MVTKTIRSRFDHEVGDTVEGCVVLEKRVVIPPDPAERRRGVYDYLVEAPPTVAKPHTAREAVRQAAAPSGSGTRKTPEEMNGALIRRFSSR